MEEVFTVKEVSQFLRISRTTIWRWCNEGKLRAFKAGRGWRIPRSALEQMTGNRIGDQLPFAESGDDGRLE
jgi:excisionase family DNA binding protein